MKEKNKDHMYLMITIVLSVLICSGLFCFTADYVAKRTEQRCSDNCESICGEMCKGCK